MKVVRHKITGRLVHREDPDFKDGMGITNAALFGCGSKDELEEIEVTPQEWEAELELRRQESPPTLQEQLDHLKERVATLETESRM